MTDDQPTPAPRRPVPARKPGKPPRMAKPVALPAREPEAALPSQPETPRPPDVVNPPPELASRPDQESALREVATIEPAARMQPVVPKAEPPPPEPVPVPEPPPPKPPPMPEPPRPDPVRYAPRPQPPAAPPPLAAYPPTVREMLNRVDQAWLAFRAAAGRFPNERMDEHLTEDGWTRKQMLAHIAAWHDLTADRLVKLINTGAPAALDRDTDAINAGVARQAIGKTAGEVLKDIEATFNRLRRQMQRLTDAQLHVHDSWAAMVIAANTYEHYQEHFADVYLAEPAPGSGARR